SGLATPGVRAVLTTSLGGYSPSGRSGYPRSGGLQAFRHESTCGARCPAAPLVREPHSSGCVLFGHLRMYRAHCSAGPRGVHPMTAIAQPLRVAALVKQVPRFEELQLGPDGRLVRAGLDLELNPYCRRAVSIAVTLAGKSDGTATMFTLG